MFERMTTFRCIKERGKRVFRTVQGIRKREGLRKKRKGAIARSEGGPHKISAKLIAKGVL